MHGLASRRIIVFFHSVPSQNFLKFFINFNIHSPKCRLIIGSFSIINNFNDRENFNNRYY